MKKTLSEAFKKTLNSFQALVGMKDGDVTTVTSVVCSYESVENTGIVNLETTLPSGESIVIAASFAQFQAAYGNMVNSHNAAVAETRRKIVEEQKKLSEK